MTLNPKSEIENGQTALGIELGSTRIKAVLIDSDSTPIATGSHAWENAYVEGIWTYALDDVWSGIQSCIRNLQTQVEANWGISLKRVKAMGVSAMMHGYLVFDRDGNPCVPFRTWRNNQQGPAAKDLTELFDYPIPERWSIAHLYQAILNGESHVGRIDHATTLAGYVHWKLTGRRVVGMCEASGMFPVDTDELSFSAEHAEQFDAHIRDKQVGWKLLDILPKVSRAGEPGGVLTEEGARLLDPTGNLKAGVPLCPPEGDAGTGMVATNSVEARTGNLSAGTSVFAMVVLEKELSRAYHEIDLVTTPDGSPVGMVHANNCTSDNNAWMGLFAEVAQSIGIGISDADLFQKLLPLALEADSDCGGLLSYGYVSGEHITGFSEGRPLFTRSAESRFTLANFIRAHLFSALCALRVGLDVLINEEQVGLDELRGHGGFFKTPEVGERIMAAATGTPVSTLNTAGEGGAWGMALLAAYMMREDLGQSLPQFLNPIFAASVSRAIPPAPEDVSGFTSYFERYQQGLVIERAAVEALS
ncbi:MAG: xylulokinase [Opitutales bacterium]